MRSASAVSVPVRGEELRVDRQRPSRGGLRVDEASGGIENRDTRRGGVLAQVLGQRDRVGEAPGVVPPLQLQPPQQQVDGLGVRSRSGRRRRWRGCVLLRRQLERRLALAIELVGNRAQTRATTTATPAISWTRSLRMGFVAMDADRSSRARLAQPSLGLRADEITTFSHSRSLPRSLAEVLGRALDRRPAQLGEALEHRGSLSAAFTEALTLSIASRGAAFRHAQPDHAVAS